MKIQPYTCLHIGAYLAFVLDNHRVQSEIGVPREHEPRSRRVVRFEASGVFQQTASVSVARPFVAIEVGGRSGGRRLYVNEVAELRRFGRKIDERVVGIGKYRQPRQHRLLVIDRPTENMRFAIGYPWSETLAVLIDDVFAKRAVVVVRYIGFPSQTSGEKIAPQKERTRIVF